MNTSFFENVFEPTKAALLSKAYSKAVIAIGSSHELDRVDQMKLANIIVAIASSRLKAGGVLISEQDCENVATIACDRFLRLLPDLGAGI